jgi:hypothetical protein
MSITGVITTKSTIWPLISTIWSIQWAHILIVARGACLQCMTTTITRWGKISKNLEVKLALNSFHWS